MLRSFHQHASSVFRCSQLNINRLHAPSTLLVRHFVDTKSLANESAYRTHRYQIASTLESLVHTDNSLTDNTLHPLVDSLTKMVCTIGPASHSPQKIQELVTEGMRALRINCSHATPQEMQERVQWLRECTGVHGSSINLRSILFDTKGPEIRTGKLHGGEVILTEGETVVLVGNKPGAPAPGPGVVHCDYATVAEELTAGQFVMLDDGLIQLQVIGKNPNGEGLLCHVDNSGILHERKGVNFPGASTNMPAMTAEDRVHLKMAVDLDADYIALSFVRRAVDVRQIRSYVGDCLDASEFPTDYPPPLLISKIESAEALQNFDEILLESDGIMVARGDLGVEIPFSTVTRAQKMIVRRCVEVGKPVIVATQMLESMITNPRPTRAEVSDVVNAVYDGADSVMLSGESAKGKFPVESVQTLQRIIRGSDATMHDFGIVIDRPGNGGAEAATAASAVKSAAEMNAKIIIVVTNTGATARLFSSHRGPVPIVAFCDNPKIGRQLALYRGVNAIYHPAEDENYSRPLRARQAVRKAVELGFCSSGDTILVVLSEPASTLTGQTITTRVAIVQ